MARIGYTYSAGSPADGHASAFRNFLNTNLTTWTVGPVYSFSDGTSNERNYFTLTSTINSEEILIVMPEGNQISLNGSMLQGTFGNAEQADTTDQTMGFSLALDGGFEARLVAGDDPLTDATFFPSKWTRLSPFQFWREGSAASTFYIIEDDTIAEFHFYMGFDTSNSGYDYWGYSEQYLVFDRVPNTTSPVLEPNAVIQISPNASTAVSPRSIGYDFVWYHTTTQTQEYIDAGMTPVTSNFLSNLTETEQPIDDEYVTARVTLAINTEEEPDLNRNLAGVNPNILRQYPSVNATYRQTLETESGDFLLHVFANLLTPWTSGLGDL